MDTGNGFTSLEVEQLLAFRDAISNTAPVGVYVLDHDTFRISFVNNTMCKLFGYSREELLTRDRDFILNSVHTDDRDILEQLPEQLNDPAVPKPLIIEFRLRHREGTYAYLRLYGKLLKTDEANNKLGFMGIVVDMTSIKRLQHQAEETSARLQAIISSASDEILTMDRNGTILSINKVAPGFRMEDVLGSNCFDYVEPPYKERFIRNAHESFDQVEVREGENKILTPGGKFSWYKYTISPVVIDEKVAFLSVITHNISNLKEAEQNQLQAMVTGQDRERRFLAHELHDRLGQTLSALHMNWEQFEEEMTASHVTGNLPEMKSLLNKAIREIRLMNNLLSEDVLENFGLADAIEEFAQKAFKDTGIIYNIEAGSISRKDDDFESNVYRIVQELLMNANQHAKAKNVTVLLAESRGKLIIKVIDDGAGYDVGSVTEGFGLTNVRSRLGVLQGHIAIQSSAKKGTAVTLTIPLA